MAEKTSLTLAPGVEGTQSIGAGWMRVSGTRQALLASGIVDSEDFAELPKRVLHSLSDNGPSILTRRLRGGRFEVAMWWRLHDREPQAAAYDGSAKVAWSDCPWQPPQPRKKSEKHAATMRAKWADPAGREVMMRSKRKAAKTQQ